MSNSDGLKVGDLLLVKGTGVISKTIEDIEKSPYSHVAGVVKENVIIEANWNGVGWNAVDSYIGMADLYRCPNLDAKKRILLAENAQKELKAPYDYPLLFWQLMKYWFHAKIHYNEGSKRECSILWVNLYKSVGIDLGLSEYPSPAEVPTSRLLIKIGSI